MFPKVAKSLVQLLINKIPHQIIQGKKAKFEGILSFFDSFKNFRCSSSKCKQSFINLSGVAFIIMCTRSFT